MIFLYIGIAGALGALCRYLIGLVFFTYAVFPFATIAVNLVGCYMLAYMSSSLFQKSKLSSEMKTAIVTGFLGSFTTFSAFSLEMMQLYQSGEVLYACIYSVISMIGGIVMSNLGWKNEVKA